MCVRMFLLLNVYKQISGIHVYSHYEAGCQWCPPSFRSVTSALKRNVLGGVYLQLYEMGLDQISVFTPLPLHPLHPSTP